MGKRERVFLLILLIWINFDYKVGVNLYLEYIRDKQDDIKGFLFE